MSFLSTSHERLCFAWCMLTILLMVTESFVALALLKNAANASYIQPMLAKVLASFVLATNVNSCIDVKTRLAMYFISKIFILHTCVQEEEDSCNSLPLLNDRPRFTRVFACVRSLSLFLAFCQLFSFCPC